MAGLTDAEMDALAPKPKGLTDAEMDEADSPVRAFAEGAFKSATLGFGNKILETLPIEGSDTAGLARRAEANPLAHGAGEFAGYLTPGPGALVKAGSAVGKATAGVAGKTAGRLAAGATEGGLFGLGHAISEDHMGDPKRDAEHIAAGTFGGALLGAGAHTVFGKVGDLGRSALVKAFGGKALTSKLGELAESAVMRSVTSASDLGKKKLRGRVNEVGRFAIDEGLTAGAPSMGKASERASERAKDAWTSIENNLGVADTMAPFDSMAAARRLQGVVDQLYDNPAMAKVQKQLQKLTDRFNPELAAPGSSGANAPRTFAKAWETASDMLEQVGMGDAKGIKRELFKMRGELQDEIFSQVERVHPELGKGLRAANRDYANAATFRDLTRKKADQVAAGGFNLMDLAAGGGALAGLGVPGMVAPFVTRAARERGGFVLGSALDALSSSGALPKIASGFQLLMRSRLGADPGFGGAFRATLETAAAGTAMDLLQTHMQLASDPEYMASVGLEHENPGVVAEYTDKAHRLGQLSNAVDSAGAEIDRSIARVLGEQSGRAPNPKEHLPTREEFEVMRAKLAILEKDDGATRKHLNSLAPTTAGLAQITLAQGARHLLDTAPKDPTEGLPPAFKKPWNPAKGDLRSWFKRVDVVADPRSVLESMYRGSVVPEQIETLQAVYPRLYREFRDKMVAKLSERTAPLDRIRRAQVSQLVGDFGDPAVTQLIQAAHLRTIQAKQQQDVSPDGRQNVDAEKNEETQAQRLEGR